MWPVVIASYELHPLNDQEETEHTLFVNPNEGI